MISKKTKALAAGVLAAAMTATAVPAVSSAAIASEAADSNSTYLDMFNSLYDDIMVNGVSNGYMSEQNNGAKKFGIPYHAKETLVVEAPDYGHETTSEAMSYIVWAAAMHDALAAEGKSVSSGNDLADAWKVMEALIPGWSTASGRSDIKYETIWSQEQLKADTAAEESVTANVVTETVEEAPVVEAEAEMPADTEEKSEEPAPEAASDNPFDDPDIPDLSNLDEMLKMAGL